MPKVGGRRKKKRTHREFDESKRLMQDAPRCFVISRGAAGPTQRKLVGDLRRVFYPHCGMKVEDNLSVKLSEYIRLSKAYGMSNLVAVHKTRKLYLRVMGLPRGPTLNFRIVHYATGSLLSKTLPDFKPFQQICTSALLVMSGIRDCSPEEERAADKLASVFPPIDPDTLEKQLRRVVAIHFKAGYFYLRNYSVRTLNTSSANSHAESLLNTKAGLQLSKFKSFKDFIGAGEEKASPEPGDEFELMEMGPRLKLRLVSVQDRLPCKAQKEEEEEGPEPDGQLQ